MQAFHCDCPRVDGRESSIIIANKVGYWSGLPLEGMRRQRMTVGDADRMAMRATCTTPG